MKLPVHIWMLFGNDKILLGIDGEDVPMMESEDGNIVVFEVANKLCSYNVSAGKLAVLFSFYDDENKDTRAIFGGHGIKILSVNEGGNVEFAVYGYMNRGRHEGQTGISVYYYDSTVNTEIFYQLRTQALLSQPRTFLILCSTIPSIAVRAGARYCLGSK